MQDKSKSVDKLKNINDVTVQGVIVHEFHTDKVAILTINTGNSTPVPNYPKVVFFGDIKDKVVANFKVSDHVCVKGNIQSSKRKENIKNQIMQTVFGESIEKTQSLMEDAFDMDTVKNSYKPFQNTFRISGNVLSIHQMSKGVVSILLRTEKNGHISFPRLVYFERDGADIMKDVNKNDFICAVGCVQTSKKETKNGTNYYEDFVILEYCKI